MKGYKATDLNMQCRGMQYEIGRVYHVDGEIEPCKNGLHFCKNLTDVFNYYRPHKSRFFEVEASGVIKVHEDKYVTSDLKIIGELSKVEINRCVYSNGYVYGKDYGDGEGYGFVDGNGHGNGYGRRDGHGYGDGYGYGYSNGYRFGYGEGYGNGCGNGYSKGYGAQKILIFI